MKLRIKQSLISLFFFLLTLAGSKLFVENGIDKILEVIACLILISQLVLCNNRKRLFKSNRVKFIDYIILFLFIIGIMIQDISKKRLIILVFTMVVIWMSIFMSKGYISSYKDIRLISYSIIGAIVISTILSAIFEPAYLFDSAGSVFGIQLGFTGGIQYKNYFGADMLAAFSGIYIYQKYGKKNPIDLVLELLCFLLLIASGSKGAYLLFVIFVLMINIEKIVLFSQRHRGFILGAVIFCGLCFGVLFFYKIALKTENYLFRLRGLLNYISYFKHDIFHMVFGNAENVYDQELSYVLTVRTITGWDGSLEFSWLDILIKNGLIGCAAYFLIFILYFKKACNESDWAYKSVLFSFLAIAVASSFVETYIQSVHSIFGLYLYLILSGIQKNKNRVSYLLTSRSYEIVVG